MSASLATPERGIHPTTKLRLVLSVLRVRGAAYLVVTALVGRLPTGMAIVALVRLVRDQGGDYGHASLLTSLYVLAGTVGQPALSRAIDRTGRPRLILIGSSVTSTACFVGLAFWAVSLPVLGVFLGATAGLATPPLESCMRTLWVRIMEPGAQLHAAFSLDAAAQEVMFVLAPLITAIGITVFGAAGNVLFMAGLGLAGTAAFAAHRLLGRAAPAGALADGHRSPLRLRPFRRVLVSLVCAGTPIGVVIITSAAFGEHVGSPNFGAWALALNAAGSFTGAVAVARHPFAQPPHRVIRWTIVSLAVLYLPTALSTAPPAVWILFAFLGGLSLPPMLTQVFAESARIVPENQLNEANAWVVSAMTVGVSAGTLLAGLVIESSETVTSGITIAVFAAAAVTLLGAALARPAVLLGAGAVHA